MKKYQLDTVFLILCAIIAGLFNTQFLNHSNINYALAGHDEYLSVREVYSILHPLSFKHFFMAIISGDVLYYGRIMFYTDALLSFIPYKIWGITGLVYSIRMIHVVMVIGGLHILGKTFLKDWKYRLLFYAGTATLYYSAYFYMVPKPEPIQLLVLALFFYYFKKNEYAFGKYFILIGIAYGIKFNVLTLLPIVFLIPFFNKQINLGPQLKKLVIAGFYFLLGLIIAVPCLLLGPVKPIFLKSYFNATFANTSQYDDDATLGIMDWIEKGWFGAYNGGFLFGTLLCVLVIIILLLGVKKLFKAGKLNNEFILILVGLALLLPVIILTGRLWPHYLWTGYVFLFLGCVVFIQNETLQKSLKSISLIVLLLVLLGSLYGSFVQEKKLVKLEKQALPLTENGRRAYAYLRQQKNNFTAIQDLSVPYPFKEMLSVNRYNPFSGFDVKAPEQKFIWSGFITPEIIQNNKADFVITYKLNFEDVGINLKTEKDVTLQTNNLLMRNELGKTVINDTTFGPIKIYKIITQ